MMTQHDPVPERPPRTTGLEGAEATLVYMKRARGALWGTVSLLASLTLLILWMIAPNESASRWLGLFGIAAAFLARWQSKTTFGLALAGPAIGCFLTGSAGWLAVSTNWLWVVAVVGAFGGLWALGRYG